jgi:hypothetical protein
LRSIIDAAIEYGFPDGLVFALGFLSAGERGAVMSEFLIPAMKSPAAFISSLFVKANPNSKEALIESIKLGDVEAV